MATLTPTLTLTSTDATSDQLAFSVTDSLSVTAPHIGLAKISVTTTSPVNSILHVVVTSDPLASTPVCLTYT